MRGPGTNKNFWNLLDDNLANLKGINLATKMSTLTNHRPKARTVLSFRFFCLLKFQFALADNLDTAFVISPHKVVK